MKAKENIFLGVTFMVCYFMAASCSNAEEEVKVRDARTLLGSHPIGKRFRDRNKREVGGLKSDVMAAEANAFVAAAENVLAAEDAVAAGLAAAKARTDFDLEASKKEEMTHVPHVDHEKLGKLMADSSELAQEVRMVFDILSKREDQLVDEMERLKSALADAVEVLKKGSPHNSERRGSRGRRQYVTMDEHPYKACVYIESEEVQGERSPHPHSVTFGRKNPPEPIIRKWVPNNPDDYYYTYEEDDEDQKKPNGTRNPVYSYPPKGLKSGKIPYHYDYDSHQPSQADIDLSKVIWLRMPLEMKEDEVHSKVKQVFQDVSTQGMDAIVIPVSRELKTSHELTEGLARALGVGQGLGQGHGNKRRRRLAFKELETSVKEIRV